MSTGKVVALAIKEGCGAPMLEVPEVQVTATGIEGHAPTQPHRRVTLIAEESWAEAQAELNGSAPWHTRRANLLVQGLDLGATIGKRLRLGEVTLQINGETKPCGKMDELQAGLRKALKPACRGGVYGSVEQGGVIRPGDLIVVAEG